MRKATEVSVDKDVPTETVDGNCPVCENICGKLSRIGNGRGVLNLHIFKALMMLHKPP